MSSQELRLGVIGLGKMGGYHASVVKLIPHTHLVGIADPNERNWGKVSDEKIVKAHHFSAWVDDVDAVIVAVPTEFHYEVTKECLLKNKHVLLEKPLTKTVEQAEELFALAQERNLALHVGHVERFNGAVQELKKLIHEPYLIESRRIGPFTPRVQNDSVVLDLMIHDLDIIIGLVGAPVKSVHSVGSKIHSNLADIAAVQLCFENGVLANVVSSRSSQVKRRSMAIHQKNSFIELDFTTQDIHIHRLTSDSVAIGHNQMTYKQEGMVERVFVYKDNPLKQEVENFLVAIRSGENLTDPGQDLESLRLTLAIEKELCGR